MNPHIQLYPMRTLTIGTRLRRIWTHHVEESGRVKDCGVKLPQRPLLRTSMRRPRREAEAVWRYSFNLCMLMEYSFRFDTITLDSPVYISRSVRLLFKNILCYFVSRFFLPLQTVLTLMKCSIILHFIWVFTVCKSTRLVVSRILKSQLFAY